MLEPYRRKFKKLLRAIYEAVLRAYHKLRGRQVVHLLHIGKTGGTAVKTAIKAHCTTSSHFILLHRHRVKLKDIPRGEKIMFFLRDPVERFISGFYSRQRKGQPRTYSEWSAGEAEAFARFETPNELATALSSDNDEERTAAERAMQNIQHVRDSFVSWFGNEDYFMQRLDDILFVGRQETLSEDFQALKQRLNLPEEITLPSDDIGAHRNPPDLDKNLSPASMAALQEWYKADYDFIKLCEERANLTKPA